MQKILVILLALVSMPALALADDQRSESMALYRGAEVIASSNTHDQDWYLPLAKYQKVNGAWQFSSAEDLHGDVIKTTYYIKTNDIYQTVATFYQGWVEQSGFELLFSCKNRGCGSSNEWANGHFKVRQLYGKEGMQRYWALKTPQGYRVMYLIERGNRKKYLHVEQFLSTAAEQ